MPSYLVTGAGGQLGQCFKSVANEFSECTLFFASRFEVDITQPQTLKSYFENQPFDGIINCAGYTQVDQAEKETSEANKINVEGVQNLIDFAEKKSLTLIHFSTDFVFDGNKMGSYFEKDATNPLSVYGKSKLAGEAVLAKSKCQNVCFRVSWLFSPFGKNFVKTILKLSKTKKEINVVDDQYGKPTYGIDLAKAILASLNHPGLFKQNTYHFAQGPETNWFGFAQKIVEISGNDCEVKPILSSAYPALAKRPMNSVLDTQRMEKNLSLNSRNWEDALLDCIKSIKNNEEF